MGVGSSQPLDHLICCYREEEHVRSHLVKGRAGGTASQPVGPSAPNTSMAPTDRQSAATCHVNAAPPAAEPSCTRFIHSVPSCAGSAAASTSRLAPTPRFASTTRTNSEYADDLPCESAAAHPRAVLVPARTEGDLPRKHSPWVEQHLDHRAATLLRRRAAASSADEFDSAGAAPRPHCASAAALAV
jgi:hypothetical protein